MPVLVRLDSRRLEGLVVADDRLLRLLAVVPLILAHGLCKNDLQ